MTTLTSRVTRVIAMFVVALLIGAAPVFAQDAPTPDQPAPDQPVEETGYEPNPSAPAPIDALNEQGNFTIFIDALEKTGLDQALAVGGPYTILAPTDEAFAAVDVDAMSTEELTDLLRGHVIIDGLPSDQLATMESVSTVSGASLPVSDGQIGDAAIVESDLETNNGLIHVVDAVLVSEGADTGDMPEEEPAPPTDEPAPPTDEPVPPTDEPAPPTDEPVPPTDEPQDDF